MRRGPVRAGGMAAILAAALTGCAPVGPGAAPAPQDVAAPGGLRLSYVEVLTPAAFSREGPAVADPPGGEAGFWAVVPGLPRPERARVVNLATGASIDLALYRGQGGPGGAIRLSGAAAEAIGVGPGTGRVRTTALRREPRLAPP